MDMVLWEKLFCIHQYKSKVLGGREVVEIKTSLTLQKIQNTFRERERERRERKFDVNGSGPKYRIQVSDKNQSSQVAASTEP